MKNPEFKVGDWIKRDFPKTENHGKVAVIVELAGNDYIVSLNGKEVAWYNEYVTKATKLDIVLK